MDGGGIRIGLTFIATIDAAQLCARKLRLQGQCILV